MLKLTHLTNNISALTKPDNRKIGMLLRMYKGCDWKQYSISNPSRYNRLKVYGEDWYDMFILTWLKGHESEEHDHNGCNCVYKVLQGAFHDRLTAVTPHGNSYFVEPKEKGDIGAMGAQDLHTMKALSNMSTSLHVYYKN